MKSLYINHFLVLIIACISMNACTSNRAMQGINKGVQAYTYAATQDFTISNAVGDVPAYVHAEKNALAIDAAKHKEGFASASLIFDGDSGAYDLVLKTLLETDGESTYKILRNGLQVGELKNPATSEDYKPHSFLLTKLNLLHGDKIEIRFAPHTNGMIPEGDEHAYARGRWTGIVLKPRT